MKNNDLNLSIKDSASENWLKKDLFKLTVINLAFLVAMLWLYQINKSSGAVDANVSKWLGL